MSGWPRYKRGDRVVFTTDEGLRSGLVTGMPRRLPSVREKTVLIYVPVISGGREYMVKADAVEPVPHDE